MPGTAKCRCRRTGGSLRPVAVAMIVLGGASCGGPEQSGPTGWQPVDSAGVVLVGQTIDTSRALRLDEVWRIGSLDGGEATQFFTPRDAAFGPEGEVYVLDSGNHRVKVFAEADGRFLRSFGSQGSGPGEFQQLAVMMEVGDSKVVVMDAARRLHAFEPDGTVIETMSLPQVLRPGSFPGVFRWTGDTWLMAVSQVFDGEARQPVARQPTTLQAFAFGVGVGEETGLAWDGAIETHTVGKMGWMNLATLRATSAHLSGWPRSAVPRLRLRLRMGGVSPGWLA